MEKNVSEKLIHWIHLLTLHGIFLDFVLPTMNSVMVLIMRESQILDACGSIYWWCGTCYSASYYILDFLCKLCPIKIISFNIKEPFKGLFTQGMVCHETYKDENDNWVSPDELTIIKDGKKFLKNTESKKVKVGPSESMSKSKRNTIDPEKIIENYGADSVRLFILSDSPPEKDVQWSNEGINSSYKFIQKLWVLN